MHRIWDFSAFRDKTALIDDTGVVLSYSELESLQNQLLDTVPSQKLTMMLCENSIAAISGYAALLNGGHPMMLVSDGMPNEECRKIMNTYRPGMIFLPRSHRDEYPHMQELMAIDNYVLLETNYPEVYPLNPELGQMLATSGSTGSVKFVRQSWDNIRTNAKIHVDILDMTERERTITSLPMNYTYGLSVICASLMAGATMIVTGMGIMDEGFWDLFEKEHVTAFHGVPGTYDMLQKLDIFCEDFPDLRLMTQAGGKLSADLHRYYARYAKEYKKSFVIMYGQCEATAAISYLPSGESEDNIGSVGIAVPGGEITLTDSEGNSVKGPNLTGELVYRGENVAMGYATCGEDLSKGDEWHGVLHTGDLAQCDDKGFLYITGRLKRFIKMFGHRVSLDEIDERIMNELNIRCVTSGVDDHPVIFVLSDENKKAVEDFVRQKISVLRPTFEVVTIDEFPVNEAGKIMYGKLLEKAQQKYDC